MKDNKFMIVDGSSLIHRAFYALPLLTNKEGTFTNAAYGFTNMFLKVLENEKPDCVVVCFDKSRITFRNRQFEDYKGHRKKTPPELKPQFELVKRIVKALGIECLELEDYEADDLIGTLARKSEERGAKNIIITGDRDALQLVSPSTEVLLTRKGISEMEKYSLDDIEKKYGLSPQQLIDLKGLMGDQSDNIPGVPGVGEKTALKLLKEFSSIENLYDHLQQVKGKLREKLQENQEKAFMSKKLATIETDCPLEIDVSECRWEGPNYDDLLKVFKELEFTSLIKRVLDDMKADAGAEDGTESCDINIIKNPSELESIFKEVSKKETLSIFVKLKNENYHFTEIDSIGLACGKRAWAIGSNNLKEMLTILNESLATFKQIIFHDAKKTYVAFKKNKVFLENIFGDTMLAGYLLNPSASSYGLNELSLEYLNKALVEKDNPLEDAAIKAGINLELAEVLHDELQAMGMEELYYDVELPLVKILAKMELSGVKVDSKELNRMGEELQKGIEELQQEIYQIAGEEFNINSPKQLGKILFEKMDLPVVKKTKTGYSTSAAVLEELAPKHPIAEKLLTYRHLTKLQSTYVEGLKKLLTPEDKIHTTFNQTITATGRLSSTEPNLQNIPIRLDLGRKLRKVFIPSKKDYCILAVDYSQIELRILAHISEDENLIDAFNKGQDIHTRTASEVFFCDMEEVTSEMRRSAKAVNFGIVYGISDFGLARDLRIPRAEAKAYIEKYFEKYPKVAEYMEKVVQEARDKGYVTTILNRRRYLPDLFSPNWNIRNAGERTAMNTPIQGSAADIIKLAMVAVNERIEQEKLPATMLLQVHDELIFEVKKEVLREAASVIVHAMENAYKLRVPLIVDAKWGKNWYDLKPLELNTK